MSVVPRLSPALCTQVMQHERSLTPVCLNCGYDLRGLQMGDSCPECGQRHTLESVVRLERSRHARLHGIVWDTVGVHLLAWIGMSLLYTGASLMYVVYFPLILVCLAFGSAFGAVVGWIAISCVCVAIAEFARTIHGKRPAFHFDCEYRCGMRLGDTDPAHLMGVMDRSLTRVEFGCGIMMR